MSADQRPWIVLVGGFLGAGKTSLILKAARVLQLRGLKCAVIMNDQGQELVDSRLAEGLGVAAREVTGGCFCCRYSALAEAIEAVRQLKPDVIFAEPVGSCTDISATVLGPLREEFERYRLAPFTVLVDPARARELEGENADPDMAFLFQQQVREADVLCISKADLHPEVDAIGGTAVRKLSARTGAGVAEWLDEILLGSLLPGKATLNIDYERYAAAEAALAWMNLSFVLEPLRALAPAMVLGPLLDGLNSALTRSEIQIVHLKMFDSSATGWLKASVCSNGAEPDVEGALDASPSPRHEVLVNLRAKGSPAMVREIVEQQLARLDGATSAVRLDCFSPSPPKPERRVSPTQTGSPESAGRLA